MKRERQYLKMVKQAGLDVVSIEKGGKHYRLTLSNRFGQHKKFTLPVSPSDSRAMKNAIADLRRFEKRGGNSSPP